MSGKRRRSSSSAAASGEGEVGGAGAAGGAEATVAEIGGAVEALRRIQQTLGRFAVIFPSLSRSRRSLALSHALHSIVDARRLTPLASLFLSLLLRVPPAADQIARLETVGAAVAASSEAQKDINRAMGPFRQTLGASGE